MQLKLISPALVHSIPAKTNPTYELRALRSLSSLTYEDLALTSLTYGAFYLFHTGVIGFAAFQAWMLFYVFRVFNNRHEKAHLPHSKMGTAMKILSNVCWIFHTPYQEPYLEKRRKHLTHHRAHSVRQQMASEVNPHSLLESPSLIKALLTALFYEEVMFYLDFKFHESVSLERKRMILISTLCLIGLTGLVGAHDTLVLFVTYRISMAAAWFSFSKLLHIDEIYHGGLLSKLPQWTHPVLELTLGPGAVTALMFHEFHHQHPLKFHKIL